jgi:hypothetical protein
MGGTLCHDNPTLSADYLDQITSTPTSGDYCGNCVSPVGCSNSLRLLIGNGKRLTEREARMSSPDTLPNPLTADRINIDQTEAARRTGLSAKTLERLAQAGERVGRFKVNRRVLFHLETLNAWFRARIAVGQMNLETER